MEASRHQYAGLRSHRWLVVEWGVQLRQSYGRTTLPPHCAPVLRRHLSWIYITRARDRTDTTWLHPGPSLTSKEEILPFLCLRERSGRAHSHGNPSAGGAGQRNDWPLDGENAAACTDLGSFARGRKQFVYLSFICHFRKGSEEVYNTWRSGIELSKVKLTNKKLCRKKRIHQLLRLGDPQIQVPSGAR